MLVTVDVNYANNSMVFQNDNPVSESKCVDEINAVRQNKWEYNGTGS